MNQTGSILQALFAETRALAHGLMLMDRQVHHREPGSHHWRCILEGLERHGPQTVPQIARSRKVSRQHIQTVVNHLESKGRVEFVGNPAHQRSRLVRISTKGRELLDTSNRLEAAHWVGLGKELSEEEIRRAGVVLHKLREWIDIAGQGAIPTSTGQQRKLASKKSVRPVARRKADRPPKIAAAVNAFSTKPDWEELPVSLL